MKQLDKSTRRLMAWGVHIFTASGVVIALFALQAIIAKDYQLALLLMMVTVLLDSVDGTMARFLRVKELVPEYDGALLDNIVDYITYVFIPGTFLFYGPLLQANWRIITAATVLLASAYQFCQSDAKTEDHFFKGFPSYWNLVITYLYYWQTTEQFNLIMIMFLACLVFVPIKFLYPSRLDNVTKIYSLRLLLVTASVIWWLSTWGMVWQYPKGSMVCHYLSFAYVILYWILSLYRTFVPLKES